MTAVVPERPSGLNGKSAAWLVGLGLSLVVEGSDDDVAVKQVVAEAGDDRRVLEGAYGRAVALVAEYPDDPAVKATCDLMARALHRVLREAEGRRSSP
ncbi:MAG TPA: hypothetical protein VFC13_27340 [Actinomycetes bacterium]|nr:hypothetical protein [Actinomycetes bacterium]